MKHETSSKNKIICLKIARERRKVWPKLLKFISLSCLCLRVFDRCRDRVADNNTYVAFATKNSPDQCQWPSNSSFCCLSQYWSLSGSQWSIHGSWRCRRCQSSWTCSRPSWSPPAQATRPSPSTSSSGGLGQPPRSSVGPCRPCTRSWPWWIL